MMLSTVLLSSLSLASIQTSYAQELTASQYIPSNFTPPALRYDNGTYGPPLEVTHYFYDQWPIGLAVHAASGRQFVCYTRGDANFTLGIVTGPTSEAAYPNQELNTPPGGLANFTTNPVSGSSLADYFTSVQALYITGDTLWVLDTGRPTINSTIVYAAVGGPKLVGIDLSSNQVTETFTFPSTVHYPDSYLNDVRFDFSEGSRIAYLVDSSNEGRSGFIVLDMTTGKSWRRLSQHPSVLHVYDAVPSYFGRPFYQVSQGYDGNVIPDSLGHIQEGLDGIALSPDGKCKLEHDVLIQTNQEDLYFGPLTSSNLYRIQTSYLKANPSFLAEQAAGNAVEYLGQAGSMKNGFESDSNGLIYISVPEQNGVYYYNPLDLQVHGFVHDPRILWADSMSVASDGYLYFTINQLPLQAEWNNGTELRTYPGVIFRAKLPGNGSKITSTLGY